MCTVLPLSVPFARVMVKFMKWSLVCYLVECLGVIQDMLHCVTVVYGLLPGWPCADRLSPLYMPFVEVDGGIYQVVACVEPCQKPLRNPGWSWALSPLSMPVARLRWSLLAVFCVEPCQMPLRNPGWLCSLCCHCQCHFLWLMAKFIKQSLVWNGVKSLWEIQDGHLDCHHCPCLLQVWWWN